MGLVNRFRKILRTIQWIPKFPRAKVTTNRGPMETAFKKIFPTKNRMIQAKDRTTKAKIQRNLNLKVNFPIQIQKIRMMKLIQIDHLILKGNMLAMMIGKTQVFHKSKTTVHCTRKRSAPP